MIWYNFVFSTIFGKISFDDGIIVSLVKDTTLYADAKFSACLLIIN